MWGPATSKGRPSKKVREVLKERLAPSVGEKIVECFEKIKNKETVPPDELGEIDDLVHELNRPTHEK